MSRDFRRGSTLDLESSPGLLAGCLIPYHQEPSSRKEKRLNQNSMAALQLSTDGGGRRLFRLFQVFGFLRVFGFFRLEEGRRLLFDIFPVLID